MKALENISRTDAPFSPYAHGMSRRPHRSHYDRCQECGKHHDPQVACRPFCGGCYRRHDYGYCRQQLHGTGVPTIPHFTTVYGDEIYAAAASMSATAPNRPHTASSIQSQHITTLQILHRDAESAYLESRRMLDTAIQGSRVPHVSELPAQPSTGPVIVNGQSHQDIRGTPSVQHNEHPSILPFALSSHDGSGGNGYNPNRLNTAIKARRGFVRDCGDSLRPATKSSRVEKALKTPRRVPCMKKVAAKTRRDKAAKAKSAKAKTAQKKAVNEKAKTKEKQIEDGIAETDDEATELERVKKEKAWLSQADITNEVGPQVKLEPLDEKRGVAVSPKPMTRKWRPQWLIPGMGEESLGFEKMKKEEEFENKAVLKKEITPRVKLEPVD